MPQPLETATRLRDSLIWDWNRHYYECIGQDAWTANTVPSFVTTNAMTASMSARIVFDALRDIAETHGTSEPVTIVELGGGTGRFAHLFLLHLLHLGSTSPYTVPPFRYILTDAFDKNVEAWRENPQLWRWRKTGVLQLGVFDVEKDGVIRLCNGDLLGPGKLHTPLLVVAHYVFDATRQDAFRIEKGACFEARTTLRSTAEADTEDRVHLEHFEARWTFEPTSPEVFYAEDSSWRGILEAYTETLEDTHITIPWAAARCLSRLRTLSDAGLVALVSDKGFDRLDQLDRLAVPEFQIHGSMSMSVNLDALARWAASEGGMAWRTAERQGHRVMTLGLGVSGTDLRHTRVAFSTTADHFGPTDFLDVKEVEDRARPHASLRHLLGLLRLSCWDAEMFYRVHERLIELAPTASSAERRELTALVERVSQRFFYIGDDRDVLFALGRLDSALHHHRRAQLFFARSVDVFGPCATAFYNRALCMLHLQRFEEAEILLRKSLELDPDHAEARQALQTLLEALENQTTSR